MTRHIITHNEIEGFHYYPNAPKFCEYLANKHRHIFTIECWFEVSHNEREIEIIEMQHRIENMIANKFGRPANFDSMSCESIAETIMNEFYNIESCIVTEDGNGGASLTR